MNVTIASVAEHDKAILRELLNLYLYDLSPYAGADPWYGRFEYGRLDQYWREPESRFPFFAHVDGAPAGFVLVNTYTETGADHCIAEFFVLVRHRRRGVGRAMAFAAFDRFPGTWEVCTDIENDRGVPFWRRTVKAYTNGDFEERTGVGAWTGPVFLFSSKGDR